MLYSFLNLSNMKKYPEEFKNFPYLGYFNHSNLITPTKYINKNLLNYKYTNIALLTNPYIGYINHSMDNNRKNVFNLKLNVIDKASQCEPDYSSMIENIINKYKLCEDIKKKPTRSIGTQCNIENEEEFEMVNGHDIPRTSFLAVGDFLYKRSMNN